LWINDPATGTRVRLGEVGQELAYSLAEQGNMQLAREAWSKPHVGFWFSKTF
jgi:hypothetical protein